LFFKVNEIGNGIARALEVGGKVVGPPILVKQRDMKGNEIIGKNLFDDEVGYLAELIDSDGNTFFLYSNS